MDGLTRRLRAVRSADGSSFHRAMYNTKRAKNLTDNRTLLLCNTTLHVVNLNGGRREARWFRKHESRAVLSETDRADAIDSQRPKLWELRKRHFRPTVFTYRHRLWIDGWNITETHSLTERDNWKEKTKQDNIFPCCTHTHKSTTFRQP